MPAAARPVPQAAQPSELFFPNGHAVRRLIRYIYSTFKKQWPSPRRKKSCTFSQHAAIANQRPMAPRSFCEQARNTTRHSRVAVVLHYNQPNYVLEPFNNNKPRVFNLH